MRADRLRAAGRLEATESATEDAHDEAQQAKAQVEPQADSENRPQPGQNHIRVRQDRHHINAERHFVHPLSV